MPLLRFGTALAVSLIFASSAPGQLGPAIFPTRVYDAGGGTPSAVALVDLDRDGRLDVVVANRGSNSVGVLRGNVWGTLEVPVTYPVAGSAPASLAIGDVDADGFLDVVTANSEDVTFSLLRGNAQGTLEPAQTFPTCGGGPAAIALGDVTGDGRLDVVVLCPVNVCVLAGNAQGGLDPRECYDAGGLEPVALALADVDLDGRLDVVVAHTGSDTIGVLRQTPRGRLAAVEVYASGGHDPSWVAVGELTGDGRPDIAVANRDRHSNHPSIGILAGNAQGSFDAPELLAANHPTFIAIDDLDGDGREDLVVASADMSAVDVLRGTAQGTFSAPEGCASGGNRPVAIAVGDVTGDGRADLVCANDWSSQIGVVAGRSGGLDAAIHIAEDLQWANSIVIADATADGIPDLIVGEGLEGPMVVSILEGTGGGRFRPPVRIANGPPVMQPQAMRFADVTGDGRSDIVSVDPVYAVLCVIPANAQGWFAPPESYPISMGPSCVAVGDVTGDGRADVVVGGYFGGVGVVPGNAQGTLDSVVSYPSGGSYVGDVALSDVDGDGHLDVLVAHRDTGNVALLRGNAQGTLGSPITFDSGGMNPHFLRLGDVTGDGVPDLVVANLGPEPIAVLAGSPSGRFASPQRYAVGGGDPASFALDDVNGDGRSDVVVAAVKPWGAGDHLCVLLGNAAGTLDPAQAYAAGSDDVYTESVALGDLDGDGRPDAVVANGEYKITLCLNRLPSVEGRATCFGDGTQGPCPCSNEGEAGGGCENSESTGGALLVSSGEARLSSDDVVLTASGVRSAALCLWLQGTAEVPISIFGDGLLCAGGSVRRLYAKTSTNGVASAPAANEPTISARSASLGDPLAPGAVRIYQVVYRDLATRFCSGATFNASRGWLLAWAN